jgi:hypothetical protein
MQEMQISAGLSQEGLCTKSALPDYGEGKIAGVIEVFRKENGSRAKDI